MTLRHAGNTAITAITAIAPEDAASELAAELVGLSVHRETAVGWDARTPPNETLDAEGNANPSERRFGVADPRVPRRRVFDDPEVVALRQYLRGNNGIRGLEICAAGEVDRAARIFRRDGFVVVRDLLDPERLARFREGCARVLRDILTPPGRDGRKYLTETGRLPHRYSYGTSSASRQMMHDPVWAAMIDLPTTAPILDAIFGTPDYLVWGGGGDVCLPGAIEYQHLHQDFQESDAIPEGRLAQARALGVEIETGADAAEPDLATQRLIVERTPMFVTINFAMSDLTWENGPIRQIPGTHAARQPPPRPEEEPEWMRLSTLVGAPAGAGIFRDNRAWHGATPNLSREVRALPNIEYVAPWTPRASFKRTMPHAVWESLSPRARRMTRCINAEPGAWPAGAGVMHALAGERKRAYERMKEEQGEE